MSDLPLWLQISILCGLLLSSAFFSMSETAMMAINRIRLKQLAKSGNKSAIRTQKLLDETDKLLGVILIGNNLINTVAATISAAIAGFYWGDSEYGLMIAAGLISFAIIIFSELTPKVIGATYPEKVALRVSFVLKPLLTLLYPAVWFSNLLANNILRLLGIKSKPEENGLSNQEIRALVLDHTPLMPQQHKKLLSNIFELEEITVNDLMTPRSRIEALDIEEDIESIHHQLVTCYHNKLPVFEGELNNILGLFHIRKALQHLQDGNLSHQEILDNLAKPYYIPSDTPVFNQLQEFLDNSQRIGVVVDEYSEVLGILTLEDIVEEIVGEFTSAAPSGQNSSRWNQDHQVILDPTQTLRLINRRLGLSFSTSGPKTLNGLILEELQNIPDAPVCIKFGDCIVEVLHSNSQSVRSVRITKLFKTDQKDA